MAYGLMAQGYFRLRDQSFSANATIPRSVSRIQRCLWAKLVEFLSHLQPCIFHGCPVVVMLPVRPTERNWLGARKRLERGVHEGVLPQSMKKVSVFVVLNAVPDGLQPYPRSLLARSKRSGRIEENPIPGPG